MQLMFVMLVVAARGEVDQLPYFGRGTMEEAENRGWLRNTNVNSRRWVSQRCDVWVYEVMVTAEGELGSTGIYFAISEDAWGCAVSASEDRRGD